MEHMEDYTLCDNRAQAKPSTAMEVVGIKYTKPKVVNRLFLDLEKTQPGLLRS